MERTLVPLAAKRGLEVHGEGKGSVELANLIRAGFRSPDVFISADPVVIDSLMGAPNGNLVSWYSVFGTTRLVLAYSPASPYKESFLDVARSRRSLVDVLSQPHLHLGRTDPALDPKGYRTIIAMRLLERYAHVAGLAERVLGDDRNPAQVLPAGGPLLVRLESGDIDAAFVYSTESVERNLPALELPKQVNLGDAREAKTYATVSVTIDGKKHVGAPAAYALTIPSAAPNRAAAAEFIAFLLSGDGRAVLARGGMTVLARVQVVGNRDAIPTSLQSVLR
jgi:molybdate/tungstate transport system substrate-binding protein